MKGAGVIARNRRIAKDLANGAFEDGFIAVDDLPFEPVRADGQMQGVFFVDVGGEQEPGIFGGDRVAQHDAKRKGQDD